MMMVNEQADADDGRDCFGPRRAARAPRQWRLGAEEGGG